MGQLALGHAGLLGQLGLVGVDFDLALLAARWLPSVTYVQRKADPSGNRERGGEDGCIADLGSAARSCHRW